MKKLLKTLSLAMSAAMLAACLSACAKTPTPEEIYKKVEDADNAKIVIAMEYDDLGSVKATMKMAGDTAQIVTKTEMMGMSSEEETYQHKSGDELWIYSQDENGKWSMEKSENEEDEEGLDEFKDLFNMENYKEFDKESRRYQMKDDVELEMSEMTCSDGYIEVGEDGTYTVFVKMEQDAGQLGTLKGTLKITISDIGEVSVTLPEID